MNDFKKWLQRGWDQAFSQSSDTTSVSGQDKVQNMKNALQKNHGANNSSSSEEGQEDYSSIPSKQLALEKEQEKPKSISDPFAFLREQAQQGSLEQPTNYSMLNQLLTQTPEQKAEEQQKSVSEREQPQQQEAQAQTSEQDSDNNNPLLMFLDTLLGPKKAEAKESSSESSDDSNENVSADNNNTSLLQKIQQDPQNNILKNNYWANYFDPVWGTMGEAASTSSFGRTIKKSEETNPGVKERLSNATDLSNVESEADRQAAFDLIIAGDNRKASDTTALRGFDESINMEVPRTYYPASGSEYSSELKADHKNENYQGKGTIAWELKNKPENEWSENTKALIKKYSGASQYVDDDMSNVLKQAEKDVSDSLPSEETPKSRQDIWSDIIDNTDAGKAYKTQKLSDASFDYAKNMADLQTDDSDAAKNVWVTFYTDPRYMQDAIDAFGTDIDVDNDGKISGNEASDFWTEQMKHKVEYSDDPLSSDDKYTRRAYGISGDNYYNTELWDSINRQRANTAAQNLSTSLQSAGYTTNDLFSDDMTDDDRLDLGYDMLQNNLGDYLFSDKDLLNRAINGEDSALSSLAQILTLGQQINAKTNGSNGITATNQYNTSDKYALGKKSDELAAKKGNVYTKKVDQNSKDWNAINRNLYQTKNTDEAKDQLASAWYLPDDNFDMYELDPSLVYKFDY